MDFVIPTRNSRELRYVVYYSSVVGWGFLEVAKTCNVHFPQVELMLFRHKELLFPVNQRWLQSMLDSFLNQKLISNKVCLNKHQWKCCGGPCLYAFTILP
jgi:hypothetical protein